MNKTHLSLLAMPPKIPMGCSPPVFSSRAIASEAPMEVPKVDTEVPGWRMTRANQTHRGRAKRREKRRKRRRKKRRGEETSNLGNHVHRHVRTLLLLSPFTQDPPSLEEMPPRARDGHQISNLRKILRTKMGLTRSGIITPLADARASHIPLVHLAARVPAPRLRYGAPSPAPRSLLV